MVSSGHFFLGGAGTSENPLWMIFPVLLIIVGNLFAEGNEGNA